MRQECNNHGNEQWLPLEKYHMENWVGMKNLVFYRDYNAPTLIRNLQKKTLALLEHGTIQTFYPVYDLWSGFLYYDLIILHRESIPYPSPRYFLGRFVGQLSKHTGQLCGLSSVSQALRRHQAALWVKLSGCTGQLCGSSSCKCTSTKNSLFCFIKTSIFHDTNLIFLNINNSQQILYL